MPSFSKLLVTGSIGYDLIMDFPGKFMDQINPSLLHQINVSFVVDSIKREIGGTAVNISYAFASASRIKPIILGGIGKDGDEIRTFLINNGVDVSSLVKSDTLLSSMGTAITDTLDNQIWGYSYGATAESVNTDLSIFNSENCYMVISASCPAGFLYFLNHAIEYRIPYMFDAGMTLSWNTAEHLEQGIRHAHMVIGNDYEIAQIEKKVGKPITELLSPNASLITTLGEMGVKYVNGETEIVVPAYKVKEVVDPTGAGDAWRGGFLAGMFKDFTIKECLELGNVMASFAVEHYGTVTYAVNESSITDRLAVLRVITE